MFLQGHHLAATVSSRSRQNHVAVAPDFAFVFRSVGQVFSVGISRAAFQTSLASSSASVRNPRYGMTLAG